VDTKLLDVRVFETPVKRAAYAKQTKAAEGKGESNCPLCAVGHGANKSRIYKYEEMDADHVTAWSKGGESSAKNCQMLCATHNPRKRESITWAYRSPARRARAEGRNRRTVKSFAT